MSAATPLRASYSTPTPYTWIPFPLLFSPPPQSLLHFTSFEAKTFLLMSSSLQPSFFPSAIFSLAMFTDVLYISSGGILAVTQVKVGHMWELETNCWQKPLSFLFETETVPGWMGSLTSAFSKRFAAASVSDTHSRRQVGKTLLVLRLSLFHCHHSDRCYVKSAALL